MTAINGGIQREGEVAHLAAQQLFDLGDERANFADRDVGFVLPTRRGDVFPKEGQLMPIAVLFNAFQSPSSKLEAMRGR